MSIKYIIPVFIFFLFQSCQPSDSQTNTQENKSAEKIEEPTDDLIIRLSSEIITTPKSQADTDQNLILNYAIDHNLGIQSTNSGLYFFIEKKGEGEKLKWGDKISVHYTGQFLDGKVFDSTSKKGQPMTFYIGNMIDGWNEGLQLLSLGGKATFLVPSVLGYGEKGIQNEKGKDIIPANAVLRFDLEVIGKEE